jgi:hypothetical protein
MCNGGVKKKRDDPSAEVPACRALERRPGPEMKVNRKAGEDHQPASQADEIA